MNYNYTSSLLAKYLRVRAKQLSLCVAVGLFFLTATLWSIKSSAEAVDRGSSIQPIIGGVESLADTQPWMVALVRNSSRTNLPVRKLQFCGGTLVSSEWVLTAAHCVVGRSVSDMSVIIGENDIDEITSEQQAISQIVIHPDYSPYTFENDIAMLRLAIRSESEPLALLSNESNAVSGGEYVKVFGWGRTYVSDEKCEAEFSNSEINPEDFECKIYDFNRESRAFQGKLLQVRLKILSSSDCNARIVELLEFLGINQSDLGGEQNFTVNSQLCAYDPGEQEGVCFGDSGGPLTIEQDGKLVLIGIASLIYNSGGCAPKLATDVFTQTVFFLDFIDAVTHRDFSLSFENFCPPAIKPRVEYIKSDSAMTLVRIHWDSYDQAVRYILRYSSYPTPNNIIAVMELDGLRTEISAELEPGKSFYVSVQAENDFCSSPSSDVLTVQVPNL